MLCVISKENHNQENYESDFQNQGSRIPLNRYKTFLLCKNSINLKYFLGQKINGNGKSNLCVSTGLRKNLLYKIPRIVGTAPFCKILSKYVGKKMEAKLQYFYIYIIA